MQPAGLPQGPGPQQSWCRHGRPGRMAVRSDSLKRAKIALIHTQIPHHMNTISLRKWLGRSTTLIGLLALSHAAFAAAPVVRTVPWVATQPLIPHDTWSGKTITLKGTCNVQNGIPSGTTYTYMWDFGDGSPIATGSVVNKYAIETTHAYTGASNLVFTVLVGIGVGGMLSAKLAAEMTGTGCCQRPARSRR